MMSAQVGSTRSDSDKRVDNQISVRHSPHTPTIDAADAMAETYIQDGKVMQGPRPVALTDHLMHAANLAVFFVTSIVSLAPIRQQIDTFNGSRSRTYGGSSNANTTGGGPQRKSNVSGFGPAAAAGCSGGG